MGSGRGSRVRSDITAGAAPQRCGAGRDAAPRFAYDGVAREGAPGPRAGL